MLLFDSCGLLREGGVSGRALPVLTACIYFCLAHTAPEKATVLSVVFYPDPLGIQQLEDSSVLIIESAVLKAVLRIS